MQRKIFAISLLAWMCTTPAFSATPIDLSHQPVSILNTVFSQKNTALSSTLNQLSVHTDKNQVSHIRAQQMYRGYRVNGADMVLHVPQNGSTNLNAFFMQPNDQATMNGIIYRELEKDLTISPNQIFTKAASEKVFEQVMKIFTEKSQQKFVVSHQKIEGIVFIDQKNKAHWAWQVSFTAKNTKGFIALPIFIIDGLTGDVHQYWNNLATDMIFVNGGGFGGNWKIGELTYDGLPKNLSGLTVSRDASQNLCFLEDSNVEVQRLDDAQTVGTLVSYSCPVVDVQHNSVYWDDTLDSINGAYSPENDALFIGDVIQNMYENWYHVPPLVNKDGTPMTLVMRTHATGLFSDSAYWDGVEMIMTFGDGDATDYYPFVSLGIGAHEISHGFTQQHSNLTIGSAQCGGLNESFSDMAAEAAEFYVYGQVHWSIGWDISKEIGKVIRYMDQPSKDCNGKKPGDFCSIDKASQYTNGLDPHYSSGVFNRAFYLLATADGWDVRKAFDVMVKANRDYWTAETTFQQAACGVIYATHDLKYDITAVNAALQAVDLDPTQC